jgi:hypothetical protein
MKKIQALALSMVCVLGSGCTIAAITAKGARPIMLNQPNQQVDVIKHFQIEKMINFNYTGVTDVTGLVSDILDETKADAVINTTPTIKATIGTYFMNLVTLGFARSYVAAIEGDAVKLK